MLILVNKIHPPTPAYCSTKFLEELSSPSLHRSLSYENEFLLRNTVAMATSRARPWSLALKSQHCMLHGAFFIFVTEKK